MNSSAYKIKNNSNLKFFSIQQWLTISTSSSLKLSPDTVNTEMEVLELQKLGQIKANVNKSHRSGCTHILFDQVKHP